MQASPRDPCLCAGQILKCVCPYALPPHAESSPISLQCVDVKNTTNNLLGQECTCSYVGHAGASPVKCSLCILLVELNSIQKHCHMLLAPRRLCSACNSKTQRQMHEGYSVRPQLTCLALAFQFVLCTMATEPFLATLATQQRRSCLNRMKLNLLVVQDPRTRLLGTLQLGTIPYSCRTKLFPGSSLWSKQAW